MISGRNASVYVSNMGQNIDFYTECSGLTLRTRLGNQCKEIDAGREIVIGLYPERPPETVETGIRGAINIELNFAEPIEAIVEIQETRGVRFTGSAIGYENVKIAILEKPDKNTVILAEIVHHSKANAQ
jgi:hypothetical protein